MGVVEMWARETGDEAAEVVMAAALASSATPADVAPRAPSEGTELMTGTLTMLVSPPISFGCDAPLPMGATAARPDAGSRLSSSTHHSAFKHRSTRRLVVALISRKWAWESSPRSTRRICGRL